jgi:hypothetical protein
MQALSASSGEFVQTCSFHYLVFSGNEDFSAEYHAKNMSAGLFLNTRGKTSLVRAGFTDNRADVISSQLKKVK